MVIATGRCGAVICQSANGARSVRIIRAMAMPGVPFPMTMPDHGFIAGEKMDCLVFVINNVGSVFHWPSGMAKIQF